MSACDRCGYSPAQQHGAATLCLGCRVAYDVWLEGNRIRPGDLIFRAVRSVVPEATSYRYQVTDSRFRAYRRGDGAVVVLSTGQLWGFVARGQWAYLTGEPQPVDVRLIARVAKALGGAKDMTYEQFVARAAKTVGRSGLAEFQSLVTGCGSVDQ